MLDWIAYPFAPRRRIGKMSAITLDYSEARLEPGQGRAVDLASLFPHDLRMDGVRYPGVFGPSPDPGLLAPVLSWALLGAPLVGASTHGPSV